MNFLKTRLRRLRENPLVRGLVTETKLETRHLVYPLFVKEGIVKAAPISSMPGQHQWPVNDAASEAEKALSLGIPAVLLFGIPKSKDLQGRQAINSKGVVQTAVRLIKKKCPRALVITDVCLCEYLSHGHCGHVKNGKILNDASVKTLSETALSHAEAGADIVAPSDMMDGRVRAIRAKLDDRGFHHTPILSYAVKYASTFYAPFRDAAESAPKFGDRKSYQMNPANRREALREAKTDLEEGADMLLVKPALGYQDVLFEIKQKFQCPVGAYSVSGEYAMIKAACQKGWLNEKDAVLETHLGMKRAGADFIVTYWAKEIARWNREK
jgi:porphobilinogen synthase